MKFPFEEQSLSAPNFLQKAFKKQPKQNALIELVNLFAAKQNVEEIKSRDAEAIAQRYGVDLKQDLREEREEVYKTYLRYALQNVVERNEQSGGIRHLRELLHIQEDSHQTIHAAVAGDMLRSLADAMLTDGRLS